MSGTTKIQWTDRVWNPLRGCSVISEGCRNCYAMRFAHRFNGPGKPFEGLTKKTSKGPQWTGKIRLVEHALMEPLHWRKPGRTFVNSMSDLFHDSVPDTFIAAVFRTMQLADRQTFQILTKRAGNMLRFLRRCAPYKEWMTHDGTAPIAFGGTGIIVSDRAEWPLKNVWLGVTVESEKESQARIEPMREVAALGWMTWVSYEPALSQVDWTHWMAFIRWLVCGGESGHGARPMDPTWARFALDACMHAKVPFFFKQWGEWAPWDFDSWSCGEFEQRGFGEGARYEPVFKVGKKLAGRNLDCRTWDDFPEPAFLIPPLTENPSTASGASFSPTSSK